MHHLALSIVLLNQGGVLFLQRNVVVVYFLQPLTHRLKAFSKFRELLEILFFLELAMFVLFL